MDGMSTSCASLVGNGGRNPNERLGAYGNSKTQLSDALHIAYAIERQWYKNDTMTVYI